MQRNRLLASAEDRGFDVADAPLGFAALGRPDGIGLAQAPAAPAKTELLVQFKPGSAAAQAGIIKAAGGQGGSVLRSDADGACW